MLVAFSLIGFSSWSCLLGVFQTLLLPTRLFHFPSLVSFSIAFLLECSFNDFIALACFPPPSPLFMVLLFNYVVDVYFLSFHHCFCAIGLLVDTFFSFYLLLLINVFLLDSWLRIFVLLIGCFSFPFFALLYVDPSKFLAPMSCLWIFHAIEIPASFCFIVVFV